MSEETKTRAPRRSTDQILADLQAQVIKAEAKVANEKALDIEGISDLVENMEMAKNAQAIANRVFSGPQSIANRRKTFELKFIELDALEALSTANKDFAGTVADHYENAIGKLVASQTGDNPLNDGELADAVQDVKDSRPTDFMVDDYQTAFDTAHANRKAWTVAKSAPKREKKSDENTEESETVAEAN